MTRNVESGGRQASLLLDLAVALYVFGTGVATLCSIVWALAPFENSEPDTTHELVLIGLALGALVGAATMAVAFWDGKSPRTLSALVSVVCLALWLVVMPPT
jgi:hypothetical protein